MLLKFNDRKKAGKLTRYVQKLFRRIERNVFFGKERILGSRDGAVVRALASHQCGPGLGVICGLSLLLVLVLASRGFSLGTPVSPSRQIPTFPYSNSTWTPHLFIYLFIYFILFTYLFISNSLVKRT